MRGCDVTTSSSLRMSTSSLERVSSRSRQSSASFAEPSRVRFRALPSFSPRGVEMPLLSSRVRAVPRGVVAVPDPLEHRPFGGAAARSPSSPSPALNASSTSGAAPAAASRTAVATNTRTSFLRNLSATSSITNTRSVDSSRRRAVAPPKPRKTPPAARLPRARFVFAPRPRPRRRAARCSRTRAPPGTRTSSLSPAACPREGPTIHGRFPRQRGERSSPRRPSTSRSGFDFRASVVAWG